MRSHTEYVPKREVAMVRKEIAVYQRYKKLTAQWIDLALRRSRLRMQLTRSGSPSTRAQGGSRSNLRRPKLKKPWKSPAPHRPLNEHSPASFKESARITE